jgi:hypothetical protein
LHCNSFNVHSAYFKATRYHSAIMAETHQTGWHPDPNDSSAEAYWDGTRWQGQRKQLVSPPLRRQVTGKRSKKARLWVIAGLTVCAVTVAYVAWACSSSYRPYERECRSTLIFGTGKQGKELDDLVKVCIDVKERGNK